MEAAVPQRRRRPMLTMADMGMLHMAGDGGMEEMASEDAGSGHEDVRGGGARGGDELPVENLPDRVTHGPEDHGPESITMARTAYRRLDYPGAGLGGDGWRVLTYGQLRALHRPPGRRAPERSFDLHLTGNMHKYIWGFDGRKFTESDVIRFRYGERLRINMINDTMMSHPIHLHGMWMDLYAGGGLEDNPRKHTVIVQPAELLTVDITADAPGQWAFHCHLLYHMEAGMFRTVAVVRSLESEGFRATAR
jgi:FtsP/CotA-like multicopper oxidase with cupredoxin domain